MSPAENSPDIRRILVALDASPQSLAALEAAAELAARFEAELIGIFIEDVNLLRMAQLPFAREVGHYTSSLRQMDSLQIESQLRARARTVQRAMERIAERAQLRWSFRSGRGIVPVELAAAGLEADLIVLGKAGWSGRRQVGSTTQMMLVQSSRQMLILQRRVRLGMPVLVAYDGSAISRKALSAAKTVRPEGSPLTILIMADDLEKAQALKAEARDRLGELGAEAHYNWRRNLEGSGGIAQLARNEGCGVLVLPAGTGRLSSEDFLHILNETNCAVLLVR